MSLFNDKLKKITLKEILSLIIVLFIVQYLINYSNIFFVDSFWIYIFVIFYFIFKLRDEIPTVGRDISKVFEPGLLKTILIIVVLNIFFSYGMLYFSDFILKVIPSFELFKTPSFLTGSLLATIIISPVSEELIFRGVFINRLKLIIPTIFAILISSLLFASLHSFGAIFSAFIFGICVALLYLKTDNIFAAIFAHFLNNLFAEILVIIDSNNILFTNNFVMMIISILAIISFLLILKSIVRQFKILNSKNL